MEAIYKENLWACNKIASGKDPFLNFKRKTQIVFASEEARKRKKLVLAGDNSTSPILV